MANDAKFVRWLQQRLIDLGYDITVTGRNDPKTSAAISDVQAAFGIPQTGVADQAFMAAFKTIRMAGPMKLQGTVSSPSDATATPRVSGRIQLTPPMPNMRPQNPAPEPMASPPDREMLARALSMSADGPPPSLPMAQSAPGSDAGATSLPLGAPSGVPMTGPGGSPAPQYAQSWMADALKMVPGYRQQPMPDYSTANSPLAGAESYQTDAPPVPQPPAMSRGEFGNRFDPQPPPMQAGMLPMGAFMDRFDPTAATKRELIRRLLMMQGEASSP